MAKPSVIPKVHAADPSMGTTGPVAVSDPVVDTGASTASTASVAGTADVGSDTDIGVKKPRGATLSWNAERDDALAAAIHGGATSGEAIVAALKADPVFAADADKITIAKVRPALTRLRKAGASIPKLTGRGGGGRGSTKRAVNVERINAILAGGREAVAGQPSA